jgi:hypothetical protein
MGSVVGEVVERELGANTDGYEDYNGGNSRYSSPIVMTGKTQHKVYGSTLTRVIVLGVAIATIEKSSGIVIAQLRMVR